MQPVVSFTQFLKAEKVMFSLPALQNARKAMANAIALNVTIDDIFKAQILKGEEKFAAAKLQYKEFVLNRINPGAGTIVVETLTAEQKAIKDQMSALFNLEFPLNVVFPNVFCTGKGNGETIAQKANAFIRTLKSTIAPSTIEGISKGTMSLSWLCETLNIKKASEAKQVLGKVASTSRAAWLDGDNANYLSLSIGKDTGGTICFKWSIKD